MMGLLREVGDLIMINKLEIKLASECNHELKQMLKDYSIKCMYCATVFKTVQKENAENNVPKNPHAIKSLSF